MSLVPVKVQINILVMSDLWSTTMKVQITYIYNYIYSGLSPTYFPGAAAVIKAKQKWDKYRFLMKNANQQLVPFVLEVQGRWGHCARQLFKRIFSKIPIVANRVSRNFWAQRITLSHARCIASNIIHRFHTMKRHVFGPLAPQQLYYFEPYFGQVVNPTVDPLP